MTNCIVNFNIMGISKCKVPIPTPNMYLLTELIRLLEQRGHIFPCDPQAVTESLRQTQETNEAKLHRRAAIIDRLHELRDRLDSHYRRLQLTILILTVLWFAFGLGGTYALMQQSSLNFFLILFGALGLNTLMLLFWLFTTATQPHHKPHFTTLLWIKDNDSINQTIAKLYAQTATLPHARWHHGTISHRLALAALCGMFCAMLLLLTVRQYSFNWESTLLNEQTFITVIQYLAWLPEKLGFAVPDASAILAGRNVANTTHATAWGSLLLGCMVCYGLLPRFLAWAYCVWRVRREMPRLDLNLPYYQNIIQQWQRRITDTADDYHSDATPNAPPITLNHQGAHWAILLDAPHHDENWFYRQLGQDWVNHGVIASREDVTMLTNHLTQTAVQLLVGVRGNHVPDRGTVRTLQRLAQVAQNGLIVQLLLPENNGSNISGSQQETLTQWRQMLNEQQWTWLEPLTTKQNNHTSHL